MAKSIHLINPAADSVSYYGTEIFAESGMEPVSYMLDLTTATVAGLVPDDFEVTLCEEAVQEVDFDVAADFIGISGKVAQWGRMQEIARGFRERGKVVLIGGPHASLCPDLVRPHCDILVRGEIEDIADVLFSDLRDGAWKEEYIGTKTDLSRTPMPRLDLYPNDRTLLGSIQTSRGCPFQCEFCDVIQYQGRKQRHKPVGRVIEELDQLYAYGYRYVFIADDNFTACRSRVRELLAAIRDWNRDRPGRPVGFCAQVSIDSARDDELLQLLADAGIVEVFIGIETPNEDSLREVKKRQNLKLDLVEQVERFLEFGIKVTGGMIVGFDADDPGIFQRQYEFAMSSPVPLFTLGPLVAPAATPLHARLEREGRLIEGGSETAGKLWATNIIPKKMTHDELLDGVKWLCNKLYDPRAYLTRVMRLVEVLDTRNGARPSEDKSKIDPPRPVELQGIELIRRLALKGPSEARLVWKVLSTIARNPELREAISWYLIAYMQLRHAYDLGNVWVPRNSLVRVIHRIVLGSVLRVAGLFVGGRNGSEADGDARTTKRGAGSSESVRDCPSYGA